MIIQILAAVGLYVIVRYVAHILVRTAHEFFLRKSGRK